MNLLAQDPLVETYPDFRLLQRFVLGVLYFATRGGNWGNDSGWVTQTNECQWFQRSDIVEFAACVNRRIVALSLKDNGLAGPVPLELELLPNLVLLEFSNNGLTGTIPGRLSNLSNLQGLILFDNFLSGTIPDGIGRLTELRGLDLDFNQLDGELPNALGLLTNLESLFVSGNVSFSA